MLIFFLLLLGIVLGCNLVFAIRVDQPQGVISPGAFLVSEVLLFFSVMIATAVIGRFEGRSFGAYGLPVDGSLFRKFTYGAIWGAVSLTTLVLVLRGLGVLEFAGPELPTGALLRFGLIWALAFLLTGIFEGFAFRGYVQSTLTRSVGFWRAAIITSLIWAVAHAANSAEEILGLVAVFALGLLSCLMVRRTGDLWFPIGFHFSWDYAASFTFGVPDGGNVAAGHLLNTQMHGSKWLTGGSVGPEASVVAFVVLGLTTLAFHRVYPRSQTRLGECEPDSSTRRLGST